MEQVLAETLAWSLDRPTWQRDALRRIFTVGTLAARDLDELTELCKASHGLTSPRRAEMLAAEHLGITEGAAMPISLTAIVHHKGVNALPDEQTLTFGDHLTIVYGANAAGKSGYSRILKSACRARAAEEVLGNVLSAQAPLEGHATIRYRCGAKDCGTEWSAKMRRSDVLAAVSVFDSHCAPVYVREKTDVAFRPFGLDVFDKLSSVCGELRRRLEKERTVLEQSPATLPELPEGTGARRLIDSLSAMTDTDGIRSLAALSPGERRGLAQLRAMRKDFEVGDPERRARELELKAQRVETISEHVTATSGAVGHGKVKSLRELAGAVAAARNALEVLSATTLCKDLLPGTGGGSWRRMWTAARGFSEEAYPGQSFPVVAPGSRCPLCQQALPKDVADRLMLFQQHVASEARARLEEAESRYEAAMAALRAFDAEPKELEPSIQELFADDPVVGASLRAYFREASQVRETLIAARDGVDGSLSGVGLGPAEQLADQLEGLRQRGAALCLEKAEMDPSAQAELDELESREALGASLSVVLAEVDRRRRIAAYAHCLEETTTNAVTRKSTELTKRMITDQLRTTFQNELDNLGFTHLAVEIQAAGGARGALYHHLVFSNAPGVAVHSVLSEGESRTLSLAAFLTELSTSQTRSAIVFDDPVCSLDHVWRERIARRLACEAKDRQVIVFTHDLLFLRRLADECGHQRVECRHQHVRRDGQTPGLCAAELPWIAMPVKERIGRLNSKWQAVSCLHRSGDTDAYEQAGREAYGLLREAWEQAVPEVLLNDVVERYRDSVETRKLRDLHDITEEDCNTVDDEVSACSRWLRGHDAPAADAAPFPGPDDLKARIDVLAQWVKRIRSRRG